MDKASERIIGAVACGNVSESFKRLNPHMFGVQPCRTAAAYQSNPLVKQKRGPSLNKTEQRAFDYLRTLYSESTLRPHGKTYMLANGVRYTPDITGYTGGKETCWEVKGGRRVEDDASVKVKMAPSQWPEVTWWLMWEENGEWRFQKLLC